MPYTRTSGKRSRVRAWPLALATIVIVLTTCINAPPAYATPTSYGSIASTLGQSIHLGGYGVHVDRLDLAAQMGFNTASFDPIPEEEYLAYIDRAEALGLKVRISISPSFRYLSDAELTEYVSLLAQRDGISMWYHPEEPKTAADHQAWSRLYNLIKAADPQKRPIGLYLAHDVTPEWFRYWADVTDIIFCGAYPELYNWERVSIVTRVKGAVEGTAGTGTTVIATPQFYDAQTAMEIEGESSLPSGHHAGHPTQQYLRFDAYVSLMLGAQGLDWYSTAWGFYDQDLVDGLSNVLTELRELSPVFTSSTAAMQGLSHEILEGPTMSAEDLWEYQHPSILLVTRHYLGYDYIFVASLVPDLIRLKLVAPPGIDLSNHEAEVLYEGRTLAIEQGTITDEFTDYDVHVYRIASRKTAGKQLVH